MFLFANDLFTFPRIMMLMRLSGVTRWMCVVSGIVEAQSSAAYTESPITFSFSLLVSFACIKYGANKTLLFIQSTRGRVST